MEPVGVLPRRLAGGRQARREAPDESGCSAVLVDETIDDGDPHDGDIEVGQSIVVFWRALIERLVRATAVVVLKVLAEDSIQVPLTEDYQPVQCFVPD